MSKFSKQTFKKYTAVPSQHGCKGCAFDHAGSKCVKAACSSEDRDDERDVIFVRKPEYVQHT